MAAQNLRLVSKDIPIAVNAHLFLPGSDLPEPYEGSPMVFRALYGGVPIRRKVYHMKGNVPAAGFEVDGFKEGIIFSPAELYTPQEAPSGRRYVPFVNGQRLVHGERLHEAEVTKLEITKPDAEFFYSCSFPFAGQYFPPFVGEFQLRNFLDMPDADIVLALRNMDRTTNETRALRDRGVFGRGDYFQSEINKVNEDAQLAIESLARRHRIKDDAQIVRLLQTAGDIGTRYLARCELPPDVLLAPLA